MILQKYNCLKQNNYVSKNYELTAIRIQDSQLIRKWRNEQIKFLRQKNSISSEEQQSYFEKIIIPTFLKTKPELILFSFLKNSDIIGYGGFVNINWNNQISEISFLMETNRSRNSSIYESDFTIFLKMIKKIACEELKFNELFTETYDIRPIHINILEKNEFKIRNRQKNSIKIEAKLVDILFHSYICNN